jgi:RNA polymerase sigma factor for flagellar operon FliA
MQVKHTELSPEFWKQYKENPTIKSRNDIIIKYIGYIRFLVKRIITTYPLQLEPDDFLNYGIIGLTKAIDKFDYSQPQKFMTYAQYYINAEIITALATIYNTATAKGNYYNTIQRLKKLKNKFNLTNDPTILEKVERTQKRVDDILATIKNMRCMTSLDTPIDNESNHTLYDITIDKNATGPSEPIETDTDTETQAINLRNMIEQLPELYKEAMLLHCYECKSYSEIGKILNISSSNANARVIRAIKLLKEAVKNNNKIRKDRPNLKLQGQEEQIQKLLNENMLSKEIAKIYNTTYETINYFINKKQLKRTEAQRAGASNASRILLENSQKIKELLNNGYTYTAIGKLYGVNSCSVSNFAKKKQFNTIAKK